MNDKIDESDKGGTSANPTTHAPSNSLSKFSEKPSSSGELSEGPASSKIAGEIQSVNSRGRPSSSTSSNSDYVGAVSASSGPGLSPSSSMGSLASEKSTLNPHAKVYYLSFFYFPFQVHDKPIPTQMKLKTMKTINCSFVYFKLICCFPLVVFSHI